MSDANSSQGVPVPPAEQSPWAPPGSAAPSVNQPVAPTDGAVGTAAAAPAQPVPQPPVVAAAPSYPAPPSYQAPKSSTEPQPYPAQPQAYPAPQPQPYGYAQQYPAAAPTNTLAIVALILGFVLPLGGIICGHIALSQIKRTGENGRGLALAGTVLGYVFVGLGVLATIAYVIFIVALFGAGSTASFSNS